MKWKPIILTVVTLGVAGIGYAAYRHFNKEKKLLDDYEIKPVGIEILKATKEEWVVRMTLRLLNKSDIEATLQKLYSDVFIKDINVGYVTNDMPVVIPGRNGQAPGVADIKIQFSFNPQIVFKNAIDLILGVINSKDIAYRLKGYINLKSGFIPISVPFEDSGKLSDFL